MNCPSSQLIAPRRIAPGKFLPSKSNSDPNPDPDSDPNPDPDPNSNPNPNNRRGDSLGGNSPVTQPNLMT